LLRETEMADVPFTSPFPRRRGLGCAINYIASYARTHCAGNAARSIRKCALLILVCLSVAPAHASCWIESVVARKIDGVEVVGVRFFNMRNQTLFLELAGVQFYVKEGTVYKFVPIEGDPQRKFEWKTETKLVGAELLAHDGDLYRVRGGYHDSCTIRGIITPDKGGVEVESQSNSHGLPPMYSKEFMSVR
jgi:hypothetical protein